MVSGSKRLAYQRIPARHLLYSMIDEEKGKDAGAVQTLFLKVKHFFYLGKILFLVVKHSLTKEKKLFSR